MKSCLSSNNIFTDNFSLGLSECSTSLCASFNLEYLCLNFNHLHSQERMPLNKHSYAWRANHNSGCSLNAWWSMHCTLYLSRKCQPNGVCGSKVRITEVIRIYLLGTMNVCTQDISVFQQLERKSTQYIPLKRKKQHIWEAVFIDCSQFIF